jgi:predicted nuclease of predicted toxin-antitoxin system
MKLLFDNNLSPKLILRLASLYPNSVHVASLQLDTASDLAVWQYAKEAGYCLITKDSDFNELLASKGFPPKVIWLRLGNCKTADIATLLQEQYTAIIEFLEDDSAGLLELQ